MAPHFEVYEDKAGGYRWRMVAANGETVASSESYTRLSSAYRSIRDLNPGAEPDIRDVTC